ncbi:hypothetical protein GUJ93_ZPchr0015g6793 [Zizania palustris]|uniref:PORR domain-containing protein n=1 Tax=Zizania palustris TaxID=103762 RepID=A0A8J5T904_ZIZPA|nr:hypothetical protein GUJ93_ZPchr0015g6793 [Zizania palustris]
MATSSLSFLAPQPVPPIEPRRVHLSNSPKSVTKLAIFPTPAIRCTLATAAAKSIPPPKLVRCPALDRQAARANRIRFVRKLLTLLLSKSRHFLPLRVLRRCHRFLGIPRRRPLVPFVLRYPTIFCLFQAPTSNPLSPSLYTIAVGLTPAAEALAADLAALRTNELAPRLAANMHRLVLMTPGRSLPVSKIAHLAPDLGLAMDFRATLCPRHPDLFTYVNTSQGHALQLADPPPPPPPPLPPFCAKAPADRLIDRPRRFPHLQLRSGLNLRRAHRDYLLRFHSLPEVSPFEPLDEGASLEMAERRACAVVREVLAMTVEKRTLVDHLTHFRRDFGLPNMLRAMLVRHPELFYVSIKGLRHAVFLVEAFNDDGMLVVKDDMLVARDRLEQLVREGKRMRRAKKKGLLAPAGDSEDDDEDEDDSLEVDDEFGDLLEDASIGLDWEEVINRSESKGNNAEHAEMDEVEEFWVKKAVAEGLVDGGSDLDAW